MKYVSLLLILIVLAAVFLVGGIFDYPHPKGIESGPPTSYVAELITTTPGVVEKGLQLDMLYPPAGVTITPGVTCVPKTSVIDMLVDTSGSMEANMQRLKAAVKNFGSKLTNQDIIGVQDFSDGEPPRSAPAREKLALGPFDSTSFNRAIDNLPEDKDNGWTMMKEGFKFAKAKIDAYTSVPNYRDWVFIFLSDGKPETDASNGGFDSSQDPTLIVNELKNGGMRIISIALGNKADRGLMQRLASANSYFDATTADDLNNIYDRISQSVVCQ